MRAQWGALRAGLERSVQSAESTSQFLHLSSHARGFARFADAHSLVAFLVEPTSDWEDRNAIYRVLLASVQARDADADLAMTLLWLGLWPPLTALFGRQLRFRPADADELMSEIADCFLVAIQRADLARIRHVAATLVANTERVVRERHQTVRKGAARWTELASADASTVAAVAPPGASAFGVSATLAPEEAVEALRAVLVSIVGRDADLVIGASVHGESLHALADALGISHDAARARHGRALARLRQHFGGLR